MPYIPKQLIQFVLITKDGKFEQSHFKLSNDELIKTNEINQQLYKKCGFKTDSFFKKQHTWKIKLKDAKETEIVVAVYGKTQGKQSMKNMFDFQICNKECVFYGNVAILSFNTDMVVRSFNVSLWEHVLHKLKRKLKDPLMLSRLSCPSLTKLKDKKDQKDPPMKTSEKVTRDEDRDDEEEEDDEPGDADEESSIQLSSDGEDSIEEDEEQDEEDDEEDVEEDEDDIDANEETDGIEEDDKKTVKTIAKFSKLTTTEPPHIQERKKYTKKVISKDSGQFKITLSMMKKVKSHQQYLELLENKEDFEELKEEEYI